MTLLYTFLFIANRTLLHVFYSYLRSVLTTILINQYWVAVELLMELSLRASYHVLLFYTAKMYCNQCNVIIAVIII